MESNVPENLNILQVAPADGWLAVYADYEVEPVQIVTERLIGWLYFEDGADEPGVVGLLAPDDSALKLAVKWWEEPEPAFHFLEYVHESDLEKSNNRLMRRAQHERMVYVGKVEDGSGE